MRDAYWAHLRVVLQHGSRMDRTTEARIVLFDERDPVDWSVISDWDLAAVWGEVRRTPIQVDAWDVLRKRVHDVQHKS